MGGPSLDCFLVLLLFFSALELEPSVSCMLSKSSTTEEYLTCSLALIYGEGKCELHLLISRGELEAED